MANAPVPAAFTAAPIAAGGISRFLAAAPAAAPVMAPTDAAAFTAAPIAAGGISRFLAAPATAPVASVAPQPAAMASMSPQMDANINSALADAGAAFGRGNYAAGAGDAARMLVTAPAGKIADAVGATVLPAGVGIAHFLGGLTGLSSGAAASAAGAPAPVGPTTPASGAQATAAALAKGATAQPQQPQTVQDKLMDTLNGIMSNPNRTNRDLQFVSSLLPSAMKPFQSGHDLLYSQAGQALSAQYQRDLAAIQATKATPDQQAAAAQAKTAAYIDALMTAAGANPTQQYIAQNFAGNAGKP